MTAGTGVRRGATGATRDAAARDLDGSRARIQLALLGTGGVGRALLARLAWGGPATGPLALVHVANSRHAVSSGSGLAPDAVATLLAQPHALRSDLDAVVPALRGDGLRIVVDATASEAVAQRHAPWLARGIHVVSACKLGQGGALSRWQAIHAARASGGAHYGDSATVGAGLPLLPSLRALQRGGDRIHAIAGVLSGSLAWLFDRYDGTCPFSTLVRQACAAGYTEPDPRDDLSGEDVRRKLLILARTAGVALEAADVDVESLVPGQLAACAAGEVDAALRALDEPMHGRLARAQVAGAKLRFVARLQQGRARVGLEALPADHALAGGSGTDNRVAIWSDRYARQPLVIQGPGAGADVTAAALLDDVLAVAALAGG